MPFPFVPGEPVAFFPANPVFFDFRLNAAVIADALYHGSGTPFASSRSPTGIGPAVRGFPRERRATGREGRLPGFIGRLSPEQSKAAPTIPSLGCFRGAPGYRQIIPRFNFAIGVKKSRP
jgi:hypothetical protein